MNIHEYQAKQLFERYGIPAVKGEVLETPDQAFSLAKEIAAPIILKAQVHAGGRGKAGGVKMAKTADEAREKASLILGMSIKGLKVSKVLAYKAEEIRREAYLGITIDRSAKRPVLIGTSEGGIEIEQLAKEKPEVIYKIPIDVSNGQLGDIFESMASNIYPEPELAAQASDIIARLYKIFVEMDCALIEINPLVLNDQNNLIAIDAKINFDDNAAFRHPEWEQMRDPSQEDSREREAKNCGLSFVALDGDIGCIVNGAGLAMATMDMIKTAGGEPANFLDVGGSSNPDKVLNALKIILSNSRVKAIVINIFGGITRCDDIASGIIKATQSMKIPVPVCVRLTGTNEDKASEILKGTDLVTEKTMPDVIRKAVELAKKEAVKK
ncbi:ADP-forming succinate--CoA ligase subunit beta [Candidatus Sumerlaeota bacterium]|nr:ADP-forming succinate--CoA ligase subunit beta [Candidatus Sumerlaeota bacterium]